MEIYYFDVTLTFNDAFRRLTFEVTIIDDNLFESVEDFNLELRFDPFFAVPSGAVLSPNVSTVYILDDDGNIIIVITRNELASLAHPFYTCLKHQLMHQLLYSSSLPWMMLDPRFWVNSG